MFVGVHERQLDERGRVALPAKFREPLGDVCYLFSGDDGCISLRSEESFADEASAMIARVKAGEITRDRQRAFAASASQATIDKQGRVTLDADLRRYANIEAQAGVVVLGDLDHIEIWEPAAFEIRNARGASEITGADMAVTSEGVGG